MVTLIHTLSHFPTLFCTISSPTAALAASIRKMGVSKSHLLSHFHCIRTHTQTIAAGPMHYNGLYQHCIRYCASVHPHLGKPFTHYASAACDDHYLIVTQHSETFSLCVPITAYSVDRVHIDIYCNPPVYGSSHSVKTHAANSHYTGLQRPACPYAIVTTVTTMSQYTITVTSIVSCRTCI